MPAPRTSRRRLAAPIIVSVSLLSACGGPQQTHNPPMPETTGHENPPGVEHDKNPPAPAATDTPAAPPAPEAPK